jgi:farnesyl-diphosphate farnesyltransferase
VSAATINDNVEQWSGKDRGDENFPVGVLVAKHLRQHVHAFYAFARNADDISDSGELEPDDKLYRLDVMEQVLIGARETGSPSATLLRQSLADTGVTNAHARELLVAFRRDVTKLRTESWDELYDYCRYSAMPVGRHVLDLHGESRDTWPASDALCASLQVLNHLQDCKKDLRALNRCYLPRDLMAKQRASITDVGDIMTNLKLRVVFDQLLDECDKLNALGAGLPRGVKDRKLRLETAIILGLARRLTKKLRHGDPLATRVKLSKADAIGAILSSLRYYR